MTYSSNNKVRDTFRYEIACCLCGTKLGYSETDSTQCDDYGYYDILYVCSNCEISKEVYPDDEQWWEELLKRTQPRDDR